MFVLSATAAFGACSSTVEKPQPSPTAAASPPAATKKQPASAPSESTSSSSLDAGESTATPTSSPLKDVYFDFDKFDLRAGARETLKANGEWLKANGSARVQLEGHCDERGTTEYNLALGSKRAQSAKDYLVSLGVSAERLSTISYGEELSVCREHNENC